MAAVDHRAEASIHNIRESTQEHRATKSELAQTRQELDFADHGTWFT